MKFFLRTFLLPLILLAACKKESSSGANASLTISGMSSVVFASGDAISIYGTGFDTIPDNNMVSFNGVPGEVAAATPNRLQVIVPVLVGPGTITVKAHGQSAGTTQTYTLVNILQGTYTNNLELTPDKKYMLRGAVVFGRDVKLIIDAGTVIYGEKATRASLSVSDIDFEGTASQPIVFTSDQAPGSRAPGDWTGITAVAGSTDPITNVNIPLGVMEYVRIEYAGYSANPVAVHAQALSITMDPGSVVKYIQASYSAGDGIVTASPSSSNMVNSYMEHIVAFGCAGDDLRFAGAGVYTQYGLLLKDPYLASFLQGDGIGCSLDPISQRSGSNLASNFTIIGYNPAARNITMPPGMPLTGDAGRGIRAGQPNNTAGLAVYNSVIAGQWLAGVSISGSNVWANYEDSTLALAGGNLVITFRNNYIAGTAPASLPDRAGAFGRESFNSTIGFDNIYGTPQSRVFAAYNDTTKLLDLTQGKDDLGLQGLADYQQFHHPVVLPPANSPLLHGASFAANTYANTPLFNKDVTYMGAFGTVDWTAGWTNFNPQQTLY